MSVEIKQVLRGSLADGKHIQSGDLLLSVNGNAIQDVLDYRYYLLCDRLRLVLQRGNKKCVVTLCKKEEQDIGLEFATYLMDEHRRCRNNCIFCFVDQLPQGMRQSLYFKDDDSRLSFLLGNYITLTNLSEREVERILRLHISPLHVSVHTTNPELRCRMMGNRFAGEKLSLLKRFADAGIRLECQLVLCPGWNDGAELARSMADLAALGDAVESVAVVPVGLTRHRKGLTPLQPYTSEQAAAVIDMVEAFGEAQLLQRGTRLVYPADEWYIKANRPLPDAAFYEEMAQLDNGVGLVALLRQQFEQALEACTEEPVGSPITFATGVDAAPVLQQLIDTAKKRFPQIRAEAVAIPNDFFGHTVTVAGLVTGGDLIRYLQGRCQPNLVIPDVMLRHEKDRFLDDVTPEQVQRELNTDLHIISPDGASLLQALLM